MHGDALLAIAGMALVTYATRAGGWWALGRVASSARVEAWLRQLPGTVLVAIVMPAAVASGPAGVLALLATVLVAMRTASIARADQVARRDEIVSCVPASAAFTASSRSHLPLIWQPYSWIRRDDRDGPLAAHIIKLWSEAFSSQSA